MAQQPVDPNDVLMTGENSFIRLSADGGKTHTTRVSHWRVLWCPAGAGHAMFMQSPLTEKRVRIYSDNIAVARWLQRTIETLLYPAFSDVALPVVDASFERMPCVVRVVGQAARLGRPPGCHCEEHRDEAIPWHTRSPRRLRASR